MLLGFRVAATLLTAVVAGEGAQKIAQSILGKTKPKAVIKPEGSLQTKPFVPKNGETQCTGEYADDFSVLLPQVREFDRQPQAQYAYCVRNTAIYECLSYSSDGSLRKQRRRAILHGTGFGYRTVNGETLLLTNQHVAELPAVTDDEHTIDDIPHGCKRVSDNLRIVDKESDSYERDDIPLTRVVTDSQLDVAVLKAKQVLPILPWKIGRSAALRERNVVDIRGFPLGAFQATNLGKVVSAYDHDDFKEWDHDDFVVDALLSPGNSGSPVLAISCKTGEFELVGIYHAGYTNGSALNVVVGIDQVRDLATTLKRTPRVRTESPLDATARARLADEARSFVEPFFPFGGLTALVRPRLDGALLFVVFSREFPTKAHPVLVLEDLPPLGSDAFGELGRVWLGGPLGLKQRDRQELDADTQALVSRLLDTLRHDATTALAYRSVVKLATSSRERYEQVAKIERAIRKSVTAQRELSQSLVDVADRLGPQRGETTIAFADVYSAPTLTRAPPVVLDAKTASGDNPPPGDTPPREAPSQSQP